MGIIGFLVFGLVVGALARLLLPGRQKIGLAAAGAAGLGRGDRKRELEH